MPPRYWQVKYYNWRLYKLSKIEAQRTQAFPISLKKKKPLSAKVEKYVRTELVVAHPVHTHKDIEI